MILDGMGEVIADFLTLPRALSGVEDCSAILDTSNFAVQAASLAKDGDGYFYHASFSSVTSEDGIIRVCNFESPSVSSYHTSAFAFNTGKTILPTENHPKLEQLEPRYEFGQNLSSCYAPSGTVTLYLLSSMEALDVPQFSATFTNISGVMALETITSAGYIVKTNQDLAEGRTNVGNSYYYGLLQTYTDGWDEAAGNLEVEFVLGLHPHDLLVLNAFGGVYTVGLWCFNLKAMLADGILPPYDLSQKENFKFKLVARKTFSEDLTYYNDNGSTAGIDTLLGFSGSTGTLVLTWKWAFK